ncbi:hypothetical protein LPB142_04755 [Rhodobacter xanthinilyticus]|uniref:TonB C-terminal domain-containing protein n=1 Tax=Rhodobacter xanthinilyticus TaxID=1850250 RepID=A0A1D9MA93_9RHOB|nr:energy transducer TonB [Rhodobacter xanthinilyticus]AOZ68710.1 hypothetical protein LPB142_04755 [Rhodobacter xanthinilyticus]
MSPRGVLEAGVFLAAALGLHLAAFGVARPTAGASSAGAGGEDLVSLSAASPAILAALADYERPPEIAPPPEPPPAPEPEPAPAAEPVAEVAPPAPEAPRAPQIAAPTQPEAAPNLPPEAEPVPKIRPAPKPEKPKPAKPKPATAPKPAKPAPAPSAPSVAQTAAGAGGGANAGVNGAAEAATLSKAAEQDLRARWGATIRARIEARKRYPSAAGRAQGRVTVALSVSRSGALGGVAVARSSGHAALDQAALEAVRRAGRFPAAPAGLTRASYDFSLTIQFAR